ncbi:hypothetical protein GGD83_004901 [Rhodoblastus sphagnicola]|uniref:DUF1403 family protein n=1 Tax=Rhodoblastus sphagnicola TaxID=333368 RepID=UPI00160FF911|nr:DUF1403 family protein [Rhodoblastus sphagnicola]MBB4201070.1 hypothetical protein [Rhodoblastus sphagnicola]
MDSLEAVVAPPKPSRRPRAADAAARPAKEPICQQLPPWLAPSAQDAGAEKFAAGAVLLALDRMVRADPGWLGALRARQVLRAAAASARLLRHREDEAALRDAHHLTRPGDDPGPAGKLYRLWRDFAARPTRLAGPCLAAFAEALGVRAPAGAFDGLTLASENPDPVAAALEAADACVGALDAGAGEGGALAAMAADLVLARRLGWPRPLSVIGAAGVGRRGAVAERYAKILREALTCHGRAMDLERRAARLIAAAATLRVKGGARGVAALLADDVVAAVDLCRPDLTGQGAAALGSDRAARRFLDRLVALGALREMTRRPSFRLYGL